MCLVDWLLALAMEAVDVIIALLQNGAVGCGYFRFNHMILPSIWRA